MHLTQAILRTMASEPPTPNPRQTPGCSKTNQQAISVPAKTAMRRLAALLLLAAVQMWLVAAVGTGLRGRGDATAGSLRPLPVRDECLMHCCGRICCSVWRQTGARQQIPESPSEPNEASVASGFVEIATSVDGARALFIWRPV